MPAILLLILVTIFVVFPANAQPPGYVEVVPTQSWVMAWQQCFHDSGVYTSEMLQKAADKSDECREAVEQIGLDPASQTLIKYGVAGDCHVRVTKGR